MQDILKTGSCSVVLGSNYYKKFVKPKENKLLKISKIANFHDEFKYISLIKNIKDYENYYCIPEDIKFLLQPTDLMYNSISKIVNNINIFNGKKLHYFFVNYAGDKELFDIISEIDNNRYENYWNSYGEILKFTKHIMNGIRFLHMNKICHLDIKPENIIINTLNRTSKIIDFGFASIEPFDDFINNMKGTPGYFPKKIRNEQVTEWLPKIEATDLIQDNDGSIPIIKNQLLVYKIDSYCFGRVLYYLKYFYDKNMSYLSCLSYKKNYKKLNNIIKFLLEKNVDDRITITQCYKKFFINI